VHAPFRRSSDESDREHKDERESKDDDKKKVVRFTTKRLAWRSEEGNRLMVALDALYFKHLKSTNSSAAALRVSRDTDRVIICQRPVPTQAQHILPSWLLHPSYKAGDAIRLDASADHEPVPAAAV
jgi:hypothetical protein